MAEKTLLFMLLILYKILYKKVQIKRNDQELLTYDFWKARINEFVVVGLSNRK
jgi:hypothetical protein